MQIVIDIDEEIYNDIKKGKIYSSFRDVPLESVNAIANGILLPEGHGDLITKEQVMRLIEFYQINPQHFDFVNLIGEIKDEKPIIEADKAESED